MSDDDPKFSSVDEELRYWKEEASSLKSRLQTAERELDDYAQNSAAMEKELESEVESLEGTCRELRIKNDKYEHDIESWKKKYHDTKLEMAKAFTGMQNEVDFLRQVEQEYKTKTRDLEQDNDDLERVERAAQSSLLDMEIKYNRLMEKNSLLESEQAVKNALVVEVQRLKDELKDLHIEISVLRSKQRKTSSNGNLSSMNVAEKRKPMSAVSEIDDANPIFMVNSIMNRVKTLETRLHSARSILTPVASADTNGAPRMSKLSLPYGQNGVSSAGKTRYVRASSIRTDLAARRGSAASHVPSALSKQM